ncbi:MAG TPA: hypothetical protein VE860_07500, partial [Chthoniobacterales bacterium]|nr:hypothetical protein [Chthoniobacterales bacterium]
AVSKRAKIQFESRSLKPARAVVFWRNLFGYIVALEANKIFTTVFRNVRSLFERPVSFKASP